MSDVVPIPLRINCPDCGKLHVDEGEFKTRPHKSHSCQYCGLTWAPASVPTVGVQFIPGYGGPDTEPEIDVLRQRHRELEIELLKERACHRVTEESRQHVIRMRDNIRAETVEECSRRLEDIANTFYDSTREAPMTLRSAAVTLRTIATVPKREVEEGSFEDAFLDQV